MTFEISGQLETEDRRVRETETERETDRQTDWERETEREELVNRRKKWHSWQCAICTQVETLPMVRLGLGARWEASL